MEQQLQHEKDRNLGQGIGGDYLASRLCFVRRSLALASGWPDRFNQGLVNAGKFLPTFLLRLVSLLRTYTNLYPAKFGPIQPAPPARRQLLSSDFPSSFLCLCI